MRSRSVALLSVWLMAACPSGDPATGVGTATDSGGGSSSSTTSSTTSTSAEPEPEPETAGSACGEPLAGRWGDCINGNAQACGNEDASCLANSTTAPAWGSCILTCQDACDCWAAPEGSDAEPGCASVLPGGGSACILDCSDGQACPDGMLCRALTGVVSLCAFGNDDFMPPEPSTTGTTGDEGTSSGGDTDADGSSSGSSSGGTSTGR